MYTFQVLHQGQVIGAVVAETQVQAQRAAQAVKVKYIELEPVITIQVRLTASSYRYTDIQTKQAFTQHYHAGIAYTIIQVRLMSSSNRYSHVIPIQVHLV